MLTYLYSRRVHWGDCDPAGIIFSPNYAHWAIEAVTELFLSVGIDPHRMVDDEHRLGLPLLELQLRFLKPARLHDEVQHLVRVARLGTKSMIFEHTISRDDTLLMEATDARVWGIHPIAQPERLRAVALPPEVRAALSGKPVESG
jgi:4-hydroxybenzoyl-CoA thioesterase